MTIWGKILDALAGFGGSLDALFRRGEAESARADRPPATRQVAFTVAVVALGAKMAKADGRVTRDEIRAFQEVFHIPDDEIANVARVFDLAKRDVAGFDFYARRIGRMFADDKGVLEELIDALFHIAHQDGGVRPAELDYLAAVARLFGLSEADFARLKACQLGPADADPYAVLGVPREAGDEEVRAAWIRLARDKHPDLLKAHGMPPEFAELAHEALVKINAAYERIRDERRASAA